MKSNLELAFIASFLVIILAIPLAGCSDGSTGLPHVFGGNEVPPDVLAEPRLVSKPSAETLNSPYWLRLGDVPAMPKNFSPKPVIDQAMDEMEYDRKQAAEAKDQYENPPVTNPVLYH